MEMETEMEKDVENGKGHHSDYIFNAMKLAKQFRLSSGPEDVKTP